MSRPRKLMVVAGARPNFVKVAPLVEALRRARNGFAVDLIHTGQHFDEAMSRVFFEELEIPQPDRDLGVGSGSQARQTAGIMVRFEEVVAEGRPDAVIVVGDVNSTVACALVAAKLGVRVAHVEAGLRSFDRRMPEEINRVLTDALSDILFASEPSGLENLRREGIPAERIHLVGNVMIDTLVRQRPRARASGVLSRLALKARGYALATLHRPSNVDDGAALERIVRALKAIALRLPVVWPLHPRTMERLGRNGLRRELEGGGSLRLLPPLGYLDFLKLEAEARMVLTDSGGVQEETTFLGVPCITLRDNTERPITLTQGTNVLAGTETPEIIRQADRVLRGERTAPGPPPSLWDGHAAERIASILERVLAEPP